MVVNQLLKYGEFGIVLFDNFQVTERTRNLVGRESVARVQISDPAPKRDTYLGVPLFFAYDEAHLFYDLYPK